MSLTLSFAVTSVLYTVPSTRGIVHEVNRFRELRSTSLLAFCHSHGNANRRVRNVPACRSESAPAPTPKPRVSGVSIALVASAILTSVPTLVAMVVTAPILLIDRQRHKLHGWLLRQWFRCTLFLSGVRVSVQGREFVTPGSLLVSNRQSSLDVIALATIPTAPRFIVPSRALRVPVFGWILRLAGCIGLRSADRRAATDAIGAAADLLRANASVVLFPEAKPGPAGSVGRFLSAPFKAARYAASVLPVSICGGWNLCSGAVVPARRGTLSVIVHPPLDKNTTDKQLSVDAFNIINSGMPPEFRAQ